MFRFAAPLLISASALNDETSLMQGMKPTQQVSGKVDKSKAISSLLATATSMLKNGETADVVEFAEATLQEIMAEVLPSIIRQHEADQELVDNTHTLFEAALHGLELDNNEVKRLHDVERELSRQHKNCRDEEHVICEEKRRCDYDLYDIWLRFVDEEYELRRLSKEVEDHWCPPVPEPRPGPLDPNGTTWAFRDTAVTLFPPWRIQKPIVEHWEHEYHIKVPVCENWYHTLNEKTEECDGIQMRLEMAACAHANEAMNTRIRFATYWRYAVQEYQRVVDEVHCLEIDRWKEWRTLTTVQCLLNRTTLRNGRPCDETTDEATIEVTHCEQEQYDESVDHIRINYKQIPPFPDQCDPAPWEGVYAPPEVYVGFWPGRCVPRIPQVPCTAEYVEQEYSQLPAVPEALYHHENSHCNLRPECIDCYLCIEPVWCRCFYLWAYGMLTGYWIDYPQTDDVCHEATMAQIDAGFYARVYLGPGYETVTAAPLNLDLLEFAHASNHQSEEVTQSTCTQTSTSR